MIQPHDGDGNHMPRVDQPLLLLTLKRSGDISVVDHQDDVESIVHQRYLQPHNITREHDLGLFSRRG